MKEINYFRGLAIFLIVLGHTWGLCGMLNSRLLSVPGQNRYAYLIGAHEMLICGATSFFVFISGFLFYHIFYRRSFEYKDFVLKKFKNVFAPYLVTVLLVFLLFCHYDIKLRNSNAVIYGLFLHGALWYIPFIMTVFICSHAFLKFIEATNKQQLITLAVCAVYSLATTRHELNPVLSMMFWAVFYLLGIYIAQHYEQFKQVKRENIICGLIALVCFGTFILAKSFQNRFFILGGAWDFKITPNLVVAFKLGLCALFLYAMSALDKATGYVVAACRGLLAFFARYSFSIYFFHILMFISFLQNLEPLRAVFGELSGFTMNLVCYGTTLAICFFSGALAWLIKKLTGKYSRMLIGS